MKITYSKQSQKYMHHYATSVINFVMLVTRLEDTENKLIRATKDIEQLNLKMASLNDSITELESELIKSIQSHVMNIVSTLTLGSKVKWKIHFIN